VGTNCERPKGVQSVARTIDLREAPLLGHGCEPCTLTSCPYEVYNATRPKVDLVCPFLLRIIVIYKDVSWAGSNDSYLFFRDKESTNYGGLFFSSDLHGVFFVGSDSIATASSLSAFIKTFRIFPSADPGTSMTDTTSESLP